MLPSLLLVSTFRIRLELGLLLSPSYLFSIDNSWIHSQWVLWPVSFILELLNFSFQGFGYMFEFQRSVFQGGIVQYCTNFSIFSVVLSVYGHGGEIQFSSVPTYVEVTAILSRWYVAEDIVTFGIFFMVWWTSLWFGAVLFGGVLKSGKSAEFRMGCEILFSSYEVNPSQTFWDN